MVYCKKKGRCFVVLKDTGKLVISVGAAEILSFCRPQG